ncbi:MAG: hypothetical protein AAF298_01270 [Cyanobacteria bacterium P01_A01_bin.40]
MFRLLVKLIGDYEEESYQIKEWCNLTPHEILQYLMEAKDIKQSDLVGVISSYKGLISAIVNGKRSISKE